MVSTFSFDSDENLIIKKIVGKNRVVGVVNAKHNKFMLMNEECFQTSFV